MGWREVEDWHALGVFGEAVFAEPQRLKSRRYADLIDHLCDAWDETEDDDRRKREFLQSLALHPAPEIRSNANLRLASILHDDGDAVGAKTAWQVALRATPDDPWVVLHELTLLSVDRADPQVIVQRASYWKRRLRKVRDIPGEVLDMITDLELNPDSLNQHFMPDSMPSFADDRLDFLDEHLPSLPLTGFTFQALDGPNPETASAPACRLMPLPGEEDWLAGLRDWDSTRMTLDSTDEFGWEMTEAYQQNDERLMAWLNSCPQALQSPTILNAVMAIIHTRLITPIEEDDVSYATSAL